MPQTKIFRECGHLRAGHAGLEGLGPGAAQGVYGVDQLPILAACPMLAEGDTFILRMPIIPG